MKTDIASDIRAVVELTAADDKELDELYVRCFGPPGQRPPHPLTVAGSDDVRYIVRVWEDGKDSGNDILVSCLYLDERDILIDGRPTRTVGIRGVRTDPTYRRRGFGTAAMQRAAAFIWEHLHPELAMLHSSEMAVPFYRSLGWRAVDGPVTCEQPAGRVNLTEMLPANPIMVLLRPTGGVMPQGPIDLCGLPW
jgi:GNAT superfamily N-acetyltransferase